MPMSIMRISSLGVHLRIFVALSRALLFVFVQDSMEQSQVTSFNVGLGTARNNKDNQEGLRLTHEPTEERLLTELLKIEKHEDRMITAMVKLAASNENLK